MLRIIRWGLYVAVFAAAAEIVKRARAQWEAEAGAEGGADPDAFSPETSVRGIADVDPVPLSNTAGEGIDLDKNADAHRY